MNTNKNKYIALCESEPTIPIFSQYWWLNSLCESESWDVILIEHNNVVVGSLPYYIKENRFAKVQTTPLLTQNLGVWIRYPAQLSLQKKTGYEHKIIKEIIEKLPKVDLVRFNMHYSVRNCLPFIWAGFETLSNYTYTVNNLQDLDEVFNRFSPNMRNKIRKAEKDVNIIFLDDILKFYEINKKTFDRQNKRIPYTFEQIERHDKVLASRGARKMFFAIDDQNRIHSALYLTWDRMSSYVHLVGEDPELRSSGAGIKLIWEAIQYTKNELHLNILDYEGSMIEPVEQVRRSCAGVQRQYISVRRYNNKILEAFVALRNIF